MKAILLLADAAEATNGKVSMLGAGWNQASTPTPPMALIVMIDCPWDQTNTKHKLEIDLLDEDGKEVELGRGPLGDAQGFRVEAEFEAGRPPGVAAGSPIRQVLSINVGPGMPLPPGKYEYHMKINGQHADSWLATFQIR